MIADVQLRSVFREDGTRLVVATQGEGPLVLMVHGFPESWISWRHQLPVIAGAGFTAAALHTRGNGESDKPADVAAYRMVEMAADIAAVIDALDPHGAILIGHDWGAIQVQSATLLHPEKVRALVTLSVPVVPRFPDKPSRLWSRLHPDSVFYQRFLLEPGFAEAKIGPDPRDFLLGMHHAMSGDRTDENPLTRPAGSTWWLDGLRWPQTLPAWLAPDIFDYMVASFRDGGFQGPLNRYRAQDMDFDDLAPLADQHILQPTLFIGGARDPVRDVYPGHDFYEDPLAKCRDPRGAHIIEGVGHWVQQEAPKAVNALLLSFLDSVKTTAPLSRTAS